MKPAGVAFSSAYIPARLAAIDATRELLVRLANDDAVAEDPALKRAVDAANAAILIERPIAVGTINDELIKAGAIAFVLPTNVTGWLTWRAALEGGGPQLHAGASIGTALGSAAFELTLAWCRAVRIARLRVADADHPVLVAEATQRVVEVARGWAVLDRAIRECGRPLLEGIREPLAANMVRAPAANAVTSPTFCDGAFAHMSHWLAHVDTLLTRLGREIDVPVDAPPTGPATAKEAQLVAEIIASPDDDSLREQFAALAAARRDPRAELVRMQFAAKAEPGAGHEERVRQLVGSHPEWAAPLIALGALDIKFDRGFPSAMTIDIDALIENAAALFALAPISTVRVRGGLTGRGATLASVAQLAQLVELDLTNQKMMDADLQVLLGSKLVRLQRLNLDQNLISSTGIDALAAATASMPALTSVKLRLNVAHDPCDQVEFTDETTWHRVPTRAGEALEAKYGPLRWLHPAS